MKRCGDPSGLGGVSSFKTVNTIVLTLDKEKGNKSIIIILLIQF